MVELAEIFGASLGIPDVVMGLTILAAGTSVPDLLSSVIVAQQVQETWLFLPQLDPTFSMLLLVYLCPGSSLTSLLQHLAVTALFKWAQRDFLSPSSFFLQWLVPS